MQRHSFLSPVYIFTLPSHDLLLSLFLVETYAPKSTKNIVTCDLPGCHGSRSAERGGGLTAGTDEDAPSRRGLGEFVRDDYQASS